MQLDRTFEQSAPHPKVVVRVHRQTISRTPGSLSHPRLRLFDDNLPPEVLDQIVANVFAIVPYAVWRKRWHDLFAREKANPFIVEYLDQQFRIERNFQVIFASRLEHKAYPGVDDAFREVVSFLHLLLEVHRGLSAQGQKNLVGRLHHALRDESGLIPLEFELVTASYLRHHGARVEFTDMDGDQQFDLLATILGVEIEVDCKTTSVDVVGMRLHLPRVADFANRLDSIKKECLEWGGGHVIRVTIPGNLEGNIEPLVADANLAIHEIFQKGKPGDTIEMPTATIRIDFFDLSETPFLGQHHVNSVDLAMMLHDRFQIDTNSAITFCYSPHRAVVAFVLESKKPNRPIEALYKQLKRSAEHQFTGRRPACLCVRLRDLDDMILRRLTHSDRSGLRYIATRVCSGPKRAHMAGVTYFTINGQRVLAVHGNDLVEGTVSYFPNTRHEHHAAFTALFKSLPD